MGYFVSSVLCSIGLSQKSQKLGTVSDFQFAIDMMKMGFDRRLTEMKFFRHFIPAQDFATQKADLYLPACELMPFKSPDQSGVSLGPAIQAQQP